MVEVTLTEIWCSASSCKVICMHVLLTKQSLRQTPYPQDILGRKEVELTSHFLNCHMTNGHVIVGSSAHESQEKETISFCSLQPCLLTTTQCRNSLRLLGNIPIFLIILIHLIYMGSIFTYKHLLLNSTDILMIRLSLPISRLTFLWKESRKKPYVSQIFSVRTRAISGE